MRTCLVTGGAGFIGSNIVDALLRRGDRVRVLDNFSTGREENLAEVGCKIEAVAGDVSDAATVNRLMQGVDVVFHQAALASVPRSVEAPLESHAACATGTVTVLDAARRAGVRRVVFAASSSAYGDLAHSAKRESDLPQPLSPYAAAKLASEAYCQAFYHTYKLETVCLRYFNVFGPRQDPMSPYSAVIPLFITWMLDGQRPKVYGDGGQTRDFTFIENVVEANLLASEAPGAAGQVFNVANGRSTSLLELIDALNRLLGTNLAAEHLPPRPADIRDSMADIALARKILGYEPKVGFEEGLRRSIDYYRQLVGK